MELDGKRPQADGDTVVQQFLAALTARDFGAIAALFQPAVRFRALVPSTVREASDPAGATYWIWRWFCDADIVELLEASTGTLADRHYLTFRLRVHEDDGWCLVEQQAYLLIADGRIGDMALLCSGFRQDRELQPATSDAASSDQTNQPCFATDIYFDAGAKGCAEGPLEEIARQMRALSSGQQREVRATATSVVADLPAWCRLAGHELVAQEGDHYVLRRG